MATDRRMTMATDYDAYDAILHHIFRETQGDAWFKPLTENLSAGVCLRTSDISAPSNDIAEGSSVPGSEAQYRVFPYENMTLAPFAAAVKVLNPIVAVKVRSAAVHAALGIVDPTAEALFVDRNTRIQIVDTMAHLPRAEKEQCAAFIRDERVLVVWSDSLDTIIPTCRDFEQLLMKLVWNSTNAMLTRPELASEMSYDTLFKEEVGEEDGKDEAEAAVDEKKKKGRTCFGFGHRPSGGAKKVKDVESGSGKRPIVLYAPFYNGLGLALSLYFMGNGLEVLLEEYKLDGSFTRFALCATMPLLFSVSIFFSLQVITNLSYVIGPVAQYHQNSKYYSAIKPLPNRAVDVRPPHVTIQMPVYKESLEQTITPSVKSLKKAMQTYARQGGTSSIFVCDDGMQVISTAERAARQAFYAQHGIGWVARPAHSSAPGGYIRAGRFKKTSNMNYGLALSQKVDAHLLVLQAAEKGGDGEEDLEEKALQLALEEVYEESGQKWKPWAANGRAIRMGEIVLIVDSDTVVPEDCFRDAARELAESPEVAIIQHESDVMQVAHHWFENGIAYFTRRINKCMSMAAANGEVAPFVGHNAFLRWQAIQDAAFIDPIDDVKKIWSDANVSEDFDMALRLQLKGYIIRWATYANGDFKEGVSLTVDDELNRWQKYAYGCSELIFNPLVQWWRRGPITGQFNRFMWCDAPIHYKISMLSYMFSYYGLAAAVLLSVINYVVLGFSLPVDGFYLHSFEIWLACAVVFPGAGNIGFMMMEYRLGQKNIINAFLTNVSWTPFFFFFFGGLGIHLSTAMLSHLFSYNIQWGATKKEVERSNFFIEAPRIWKRFWLAFLISFILIAGMIILSTDLIPIGWQVRSSDWAVIFPVAINAACHILFPIVLNPWLMIFSY